MSPRTWERASGCCWPMDLAAFCILASNPMFALFIISDRIAFDLLFDSMCNLLSLQRFTL